MIETKEIVKLAKIEGTFLGREDHGILTAWLYLDYGDSGHQGAGGYSFDSYDEKLKRRVGHRFGMNFISNVLKVAGVDSWEKLTGRHVYAIIEDGLVVGLRQLETEGKNEFYFKKLAEESKN